jgi:hypothetical protein
LGSAIHGLYVRLQGCLHAAIIPNQKEGGVEGCDWAEEKGVDVVGSMDAVVPYLLNHITLLL